MVINMENIDIRKYIIDNFKEDNEDKIKDSIETTIKYQDEDALIGLGVLFELYWETLDNKKKDEVISSVNTKIKS